MWLKGAGLKVIVHPRIMARKRFIAIFEYDFNLENKTLAQGHDTPLDKRKQL